MPMSIYTVPSTKIVHETKVDFSVRHDYCAPIYLVQYDHSIPVIAVTLRNQQASYKLDDSYEVWVRWRKPDNTFIRKKALGCNSSKNVVYFEVTQQMVMMYGSTKPVVELVIPGSTGTDPQVASSASFNVVIERNPIQNGDIQSMDQYEDPYGNVTYTKSQIDAKFYNKAQTDAKYAPIKINGDNISNEAVDASKLSSKITDLLYISNKSNYTLLFDSNFKLQKVYDIASIGAANLDSPTAKYLFVPSKVTKIQSGAGVKLPKLTNVYINHFKNDINIDSGAFSSSVSVSYVKDSKEFNTFDYIAKDLILTHTDIDSKYNSSNIELGTATLTPYSTIINKIKSATCLYEKIGDIVIVNVTVIMNATSLGGTSSIALLNMPFSNNSDVLAYDIGISKNGGMFKGTVTRSAWLTFTTLNKQKYDFVADEQVNFSLIYKI